MLPEPLSNDAAKRLAVEILASGEVLFSDHARKELAADGIDEQAALRTIRSGYVELSELVRGSWRYRFYARDLLIVVAFRSDESLVIVTGWRIKP